MTAKAILWTYKPRKNGTCNIKIYIHQGKQKKYLKTDYYARPEEWDASLGRFLETSPFARKVNGILAKLEHEAMAELVGAQTSLLQFMDNHIQECRDGRHDVAPNTIRQYQTTLNRMRGYAAASGRDDIRFDDVDLSLYADFKKHLMGTGCGAAGTSKHVRILKKFMRLSWEIGLHTNEAFRLKAFSAYKAPTKKKVYLSPEEIESIANLDLEYQPVLRKERDRFLLSYYLLLRYGDSLKVSEGDVVNNGGQFYYQNISEKTHEISFVPIKPAAMKILQDYNFDLSGGANQIANRNLKTITAMAGINTVVRIEGGKTVPKSSLITTHTARRSAATNLHLAGVPLSEIMQLGGWKEEGTLKAYLLAGGIELAKVSAGREFFR